MNLKQLVLSVGMLVFVGAVVAGGTGAFFSDTETSAGNVFTAGDVTLTLGNLTHTYLAGPENLPTNYFALNQDGKSFTFNDLKPLDWGEIKGNLVNEGNPAFICARVVAPSTSGVSPFQDLLKFRVNGGNGLTFAQTVSQVGLNQWFSLNPNASALALGTGATTSAPVQYCFGDFVANNGACVLNPLANYNAAQGQSLTLDLEFYAVQQRNNENFSCASLEDSVAVRAGDLATDIATLQANPTKWLFHNDSMVGTSPNIVMVLNQFNAEGGVNNIVPFTGSNGAAYMKLDAGTSTLYVAPYVGQPRYNIATYQFKDVKLTDISSMKYRIYDASVSGETPYLHFNIDFNNSDTWQRRLVQVPSGVVSGSWTEVNALTGAWTLSGGTWPAGLVDISGTTPGSVARTWADIFANYPNAETRSTDSFFGIRVGHPGPVGEEGYVDWVEFDGIKYDFVN